MFCMVTFATPSKLAPSTPPRAPAPSRVGHFVAISCSVSDDSRDLFNADSRTQAQLVSPSRDPIGYEDAYSTYGFVGNNPTNWKDPSGAARVVGSAGCEEFCKTVTPPPPDSGGSVYCMCTFSSTPSACGWNCAKCACLFDSGILPVGICPELDKCGLEHEKDHFPQTVDCNKGTEGGPLKIKDPSKKPVYECLAWTKEKRCLEASRANKLITSTPACEGHMNDRIKDLQTALDDKKCARVIKANPTIR